MRELFAVACRAFPPGHRARRSDEVVDTALLAAEGSLWGGAREAVSLVAAGMHQRLRAEAARSWRHGASLLAGVLGVVNLAVAVAGLTSGFGTYSGPSVLLWGVRYGRLSVPFIIDAWWIAFTIAAAGVVLGLVLGRQSLAVSSALANLGLVVYDAFLVNGFAYDGKGHFDVFTTAWTASFPGGRQWLATAIVLALATIASRPRRLPLTWLPLALLVVGLLVLACRETRGSFFFLRWPLLVLVLLAVSFGALAPRLAVLALGVSVAAIPSAVAYLTTSSAQSASSGRITSLHHGPVMVGIVATVLALGVLLPLAQLTHRRPT